MLAIQAVWDLFCLSGIPPTMPEMLQERDANTATPSSGLYFIICKTPFIDGLGYNLFKPVNRGDLINIKEPEFK
jgi:hypothetical protein